ncbi:sensor histidine kinase [Aerococcaceae bacterium NML190938]|nr:sensor histidine kinase [Aerococcaceae bacterium NML190938]
MEKRYVTWVRYMYLVLILMDIVTGKNHLYSQWMPLAWVLLYIVHTQLRYNHWFRGGVSFVGDIVCLMGALQLATPLSSLWAATAFDIWAYLPPKKALPLSCLVTGLSVSVITKFPEVALWHAAIMGMSMLFAYVYRQLSRRNVELEEKRFFWQGQYEQQSQRLSAMVQGLSSLEETYTLKERHRISRDIHDSVGHSLSTIIIQLGAMAKLSEDIHPVLSQMSSELRDFAAESLQDVRKVVHDLHVDMPDSNRLVNELEMLFTQMQQTGLTVHFHHNVSQQVLTQGQANFLYRTIQECMTNGLKHGQATVVRITLVSAEQSLLLTIQDDGTGTKQVEFLGGLQGIRERLTELGGTMTVESAPQQGFRVQIILPIMEGVMQR